MPLCTQTKYVVLTKADIHRRQQEVIDAVTSVLGISAEDAERILRKYKWYGRIGVGCTLASLLMAGDILNKQQQNKLSHRGSQQAVFPQSLTLLFGFAHPALFSLSAGGNCNTLHATARTRQGRQPCE